MSRVVVDLAEEPDQLTPLAALNELTERLVDGLTLGPVPADRECLFEELVVDGEVRGHTQRFYTPQVCESMSSLPLESFALQNTPPQGVARKRDP